MSIQVEVESPKIEKVLKEKEALGPFDVVCFEECTPDVAKKLHDFSTEHGFVGKIYGTEGEEEVAFEIVVDQRKTPLDYWKGYTQILNGKDPTTFAQDDTYHKKAKHSAPTGIEMGLAMQKV